MDGHRALNLIMLLTDHATALPAADPQRGTIIAFLMTLLSNPAIAAWIASLLAKLTPAA